MSNFIEIDYSGLQGLSEAFRQAPAIASEELGNAMAEADELLLTQVEAYAPIGANAFLTRSLFHEEEINESGVIGLVASPMSYAEAVELGTKPHFPPIQPFIDWVMHGPMGIPEKDARNVAFLVARKISRVGTKGQFMFRRALAQQQAAIQRIFEAAVGRIAARMVGNA